MVTASANFGFLRAHGARLLEAALAAERQVFADPVAALMRLRLFGELLAQEAAAYVGVYGGREQSQLDLLRAMDDRGALTREVAGLFHSLRRAGNAAAHDGEGTRHAALEQLKIARSLAVWFHRSFGGDAGFKAGPFAPPADPSVVDRLLAKELNRLREEQREQLSRVGSLEAEAKRSAARRAEAEQRAAEAQREAEAAFRLAEESEGQRAAAEAEWRARLDQLQAATAAQPTAQVTALADAAQVAGDIDALDLDEAATRALVDQQLHDAGWEADSIALRYSEGARPIKGKNRAIAEWPTRKGPADYLLFVGLMPVGVIEAKRKKKNVPGSIEQAKRYSRAFGYTGEPPPPGGPWKDGSGREYGLPFLFATNGRPYLRQLETQSGVWFLDARRATNHPRALEGWYTPAGLQDLLRQDIDDAHGRLANEPTDYLGLREYQLDAVKAVEAAIVAEQRDILLAMATGTGKTRTALGLIYRLIKSGRFRRVLFLVDRTALGEQAHNAFKDVRLEQQQSIGQIYDVKGLGDLTPAPETKLHVATVQGMVKRLLYPSDNSEPVPVDWYDCVIVDECHRGYALDREMSETEVQFRSEADYISKYRRVLDHFDAVRIGLTATPALHTTEIFGAPIFEYGYRQAVIDGYLCDHEPPIRLMTRLAQEGIHWAQGEEVTSFDTGTGQIQLFNTPDEIDIDVTGFNTQVITESFNRVVCQMLAEQIDPSLPGKTMVFCATDAHADLVVVLLKQAFEEQYGEVEDDAVMKITGNADRPLDKLRHFKNERLPAVAVTVDLLTTGIDVPEIVNLVFIRRVKSRILYEQMMGRATRLCEDIDKECFRIYDAVDLYRTLEAFTSMTPVVTRPNLSFGQLVEELLTVDDLDHKASVMSEIAAKLQARKRRLKGERGAQFETAAGAPVRDVLAILKGDDVAAAVAFFCEHPGVAAYLDDLNPTGGRRVYVSEHDDEGRGIERGYGEAKKPEEYLAGFRAYIHENANALDALLIVTQRPRELTRKQLRELKLALDREGYGELALQTAYRDLTNQDITASIIGFIRQQALGSALIPYGQRVEQAMQRVLTSRPWTDPQRKWLERIGKQLLRETIVDRAAIDEGEFKQHGGFNRLNKVFGGTLEQLLGDIQDELWRDAG